MFHQPSYNHVKFATPKGKCKLLPPEGASTANSENGIEKTRERVLLRGTQSPNQPFFLSNGARNKIKSGYVQKTKETTDLNVMVQQFTTFKLYTFLVFQVILTRIIGSVIQANLPTVTPEEACRGPTIRIGKNILSWKMAAYERWCFGFDF